MPGHKFRVGQFVQLQPDASIRASGVYEVVQLVPGGVDGILQYRIKGSHEQHERMVREHQLTSAGQTERRA
jgi:hypothetical protein